MRKNISRFVPLFLLLVFLFPSQAGAVHVNPLRLILSVENGTIYKGSIVLTNPRDKAITLDVRTGEYRALQSASAQLPVDYALRTLPSCADWIQLEQNRYEIDAHQSIPVYYTITVPHGRKRESVASIIFDRATDMPKGHNLSDGIVEVVARFSIPVFISITGHDELQGELLIESVSEAPRPDYIEIKSLLMNSGSRHFRAIGTVAVFSEVTGRLVVEQPTGHTLPVFAGYGEHLSVMMPSPSEGDYLATLTVDIGEDRIVQDKLAFRITKDGAVKRASPHH